MSQLHRGQRQAVPIGKRGGLGPAPFAMTGKVADSLTGEAQAGRLTETDLAHDVMNGCATDIEGDLAHANVGRIDEDAGQVQFTAFGSGDITNGVATDAQRAWPDLDQITRLPTARLER